MMKMKMKMKMKMMISDEFQESDVIFWDEYDSTSSGGGGRNNEYNFNFRDQKAKGKKKQRKRQSSGSVPIHIPRNVTTCSSSSDEDEQVLPPHLMAAKRMDEGMAFSVKGGYGRALKGRELSEFRNSILRMTGFLETTMDG